MLSGNNSILKQAGRAKEETERTQIEEALRLTYIDLIGKDVLNYSNKASLDEAVTIVQNQGYKDKIKGISGGAYKLSSENIILSTTGEESDKTQTINLEKDTSAESGGTYYAVINGKYFKIEENDGDIKIAKEPSNVDPNSQGDTINITSSDVTIAKENDKVIATFEVTAEDTVKVTAANEGNSTITINANGKTYTANLTVVGTIEQAPVNLDGAMELLAETNNTNGKNQDIKDVVMTTSDPNVATVTTEGIVKCNKVADKEAIISAKQGETTRYFKVKSTATLATPNKMDSNKTIDGKTTGTSNNPIIPKDFYPVNTEKAKWTYDSTNNKVTDVDEGLVIMDEKGNQFVWVPVRDIKDMVMCANNNKDGHTCNIVFDGTNISCTATGHSEEIVGKLYATETGEKFKQNTTPYTYTKDSGLREPDAVTGYDNKQTQYTVDDRATQLSKFKEMAISVAKNGGFYIGRYEASLINNETRVVAGATSMSATEDSANRWYGLYARQRNFVDDNRLTSVESSMIWGSQYDAMLNWMQGTGIDVTVTASSSNNTGRNNDENRRTGVVAKDKLNNIYDIFGLRHEWTMEAYNTYSRVSRGGRYDNDTSPSNRNSISASSTNDYYSSRSTLYIQ